MRSLGVITLLGFAIIALFAVAMEAEASASPGSCSQAAATTATLDTRVVVWTQPSNDGDECSISSLRWFAPGEAITLRCVISTDGIGSPPNPTTVTVTLVSDNTDFGSATPTPIRTITPTCPLTPGTIATISCTSDGTTTGTPRAGIIRIHVRMQHATYDEHSENGDTPARHGIIVCSTALSTLTESNPQTTKYQPEDTIGTSYAGTAQFDSTNTGDPWLRCSDPGLIFTPFLDLGDDFLTTTTDSRTTTVIGSLIDRFPDDCTPTFGFRITRNSAVTGFTTIPYTTINGTLPTGVTLTTDGRNATFTPTGKTVDRTITQVTSCEYHINASATVVTQVEVLEGVTSHCHNGWTYARGGSIPNNQAGRGFTVRTSPPSTNNYPSVDFLTGGGGSTSWTAVSITNPALGVYHGGIQTFSTTARTEAVLLGIGNITQTFTLTNVRTFDALTNAKTSGGANESVFILANDQQFLSARALRNVRGELLSGVNVVCQRTKPDASVEAAVNMGNTDATGHTAFIEFGVIAPSGQWTTVCTSTAAGNTASYTIRYFHISPFTADTNVVIEWKVNATGRLTIAAGIHSVKLGESAIEQDFFDDTNDVSFEVVARACDGCVWWPVTSGKLIQAGTNPYWASNVTLPGNFTNGGYLHIHVWGNFTGRMFLGTAFVSTSETVLDMTTFFDAQPVKIIPVLILLGFAIWGLNKASNKYTGLSFALCNLLGIFAIAGSKSYYESLNVGTYIAGFGVVGLLAITVLTLVKSWTKPAV